MFSIEYWLSQQEGLATATAYMTFSLTDPCSGILTSLVDGKNQNTTWLYDQYGPVTNKVSRVR